MREYPNSITVIILDTNDVVKDTFDIPPQVNDELIIIGRENASIVVPTDLSTFIVHVSMINDGRKFLPIPLKVFGETLIFIYSFIIILC